MGQYYLIVNLDKKQYLSPCSMNCGSKLREFSETPGHINTALAMLTAPSNGAGGGDVFQWLNDYPEDEDLPEGTKELFLATSSGPSMMRNILIVPELSGVWAGDRIVTCGDYIADGLFMSKSSQLRVALKCITQRFAQDNDATLCPVTWAGFTTTKVIKHIANLYNYAIQEFEDISDEVVKQLKFFRAGGYVSVEENIYTCLSRLCARAFQDAYILRLPGRKDIRDLTWMDWQIFDSFVLSFFDADNLKIIKAWIRKQLCLPWQTKILKYYQWDNIDQRIRCNDVKCCHTMDECGLKIVDANEWIPKYRYHWPPILPPKNYINAGIRNWYYDSDSMDLLPAHLIAPMQTAQTKQERAITFEDSNGHSI